MPRQISLKTLMTVMGMHGNLPRQLPLACALVLGDRYEDPSHTVTHDEACAIVDGLGVDGRFFRDPQFVPPAGPTLWGERTEEDRREDEQMMFEAQGLADRLFQELGVW